MVATSALGMGFDKSDLGFVIHYQAPEDRLSVTINKFVCAGRGIDEAYGVLLSGHER